MIMWRDVAKKTLTSQYVISVTGEIQGTTEHMEGMLHLSLWGQKNLLGDREAHIESYMIRW